VAERALLRLHRLQVRFLGVDLVLDAQQFADRSRVRQQRAELGNGRLVRGDLAVHVGHLLGHVLGLLLQGQLGAETVPELAEYLEISEEQVLDGLPPLLVTSMCEVDLARVRRRRRTVRLALSRGRGLRMLGQLRAELVGVREL